MGDTPYVSVRVRVRSGRRFLRAGRLFCFRFVRPLARTLKEGSLPLGKQLSLLYHYFTLGLTHTCVGAILMALKTGLVKIGVKCC